MTDDFYDLLGVGREASREEIRRAYRQQVRQYHPDLNDDPRAPAQFTALKKAYETLGDPKEREAYERMGHDEYVRKRISGLPSPEQWRIPGRNGSGGEPGDGSDGGSRDGSKERSKDGSSTGSRDGATGGSGSGTAGGSGSGTAKRSSDASAGGSGGDSAGTSGDGTAANSAGGSNSGFGTGSAGTAGGTSTRRSAGGSRRRGSGSRSRDRDGSGGGGGRRGGSTPGDGGGSFDDDGDRRETRGSGGSSGWESRVPNPDGSSGGRDPWSGDRAKDRSGSGGALGPNGSGDGSNGRRTARTGPATGAGTARDPAHAERSAPAGAGGSAGAVSATGSGGTAGNAADGDRVAGRVVVDPDRFVERIKRIGLGWPLIGLADALYLLGLAFYLAANAAGVERLLAASSGGVESAGAALAAGTGVEPLPAFVRNDVTAGATVGGALVIAGAAALPSVYAFIIRETRINRTPWRPSYLYVVGALGPIGAMVLDLAVVEPGLYLELVGYVVLPVGAIVGLPTSAFVLPRIKRFLRRTWRRLLG